MAGVTRSLAKAGDVAKSLAKSDGGDFAASMFSLWGSASTCELRTATEVAPTASVACPTSAGACGPRASSTACESLKLSRAGSRIPTAETVSASAVDLTWRIKGECGGGVATSSGPICDGTCVAICSGSKGTSCSERSAWTSSAESSMDTRKPATEGTREARSNKTRIGRHMGSDAARQARRALRAEWARAKAFNTALNGRPARICIQQLGKQRN